MGYKTTGIPDTDTDMRRREDCLYICRGCRSGIFDLFITQMPDAMEVQAAENSFENRIENKWELCDNKNMMIQ
jgi:hypothetical protein